MPDTLEEALARLQQSMESQDNNNWASSNGQQDFMFPQPRPAADRRPRPAAPAPTPDPSPFLDLGDGGPPQQQPAQQAQQQQQQQARQTMRRVPATTVGATGTVRGQRAGLPEGGVVGAPDLGRAQSLLQWASQVPNGEAILRSMGIMPQVSTIAPPGSQRDPGVVTTGIGQPGQIDFARSAPGGFAAYNGPTVENPGAFGVSTSGGTPHLVSGSGGRQERRRRDEMFRNGINADTGRPFTDPNNAQMPGAPGAPGGSAGAASGGAGLQGQLEQSITGLLRNPSGLAAGEQDNMRTRARETIGSQTRQSGDRARADAVRRGAASSDADISDQLGRIEAEGARNMSYADQDISRTIGEMNRTGTIAGAGAGTNLLGTLFQDRASERELEAILAQLQQASNPGNAGLASIFGG